MPGPADHTPLSELCYLEASKVESPAGVLSDLHLLTADGERLGTIEGVIIEPAARRVRYFYVRSPGWFGRRRYLLAAEQLAQLELERKTLRVSIDLRVGEVPDLDTAALRRLSDDDLQTTFFPSYAA